MIWGILHLNILHAAQVGIVIEGRIDLKTEDYFVTIKKAISIYYLPSGVKHSGKIYARYADITFFDEPGRYKEKSGKIRIKALRADSLEQDG